MHTLNQDQKRHKCHVVNWEKERLKRGKMTFLEAGKIAFESPKEGLDYLLYEKELDKDISLLDYQYLCFSLQVKMEHSMCFQLSFFEKKQEDSTKEEPEMRIIFGLLPGVETVVPFDFKILDSQVIFPERTMGRLKMSIFGKPVRVGDIEEIRFQTAPGFDVFSFEAGNASFCIEQPDCPVNPQNLVDELGQWSLKEWKGKVKSREEATRILKELLEKAEASSGNFPFSDWDQYGGCSNKKFTASGWFHVERENGRFWLVDPLGNGFLSSGLDCIVPGVSTRVPPVKYFMGEEFWNTSENFFDFGIENLKAAFGEDWKLAWMKIVKHYLISWGINTIGNWSDLEFIRFAKMPYVLPLDSIAECGFPHSKTFIFRDFPDVFSKEFEETSKEYGKALEPFLEDDYFIGYFMRNEPEWAFVYGLNIAEEMLANPKELESKHVFVNRMKEKYKEIENFNDKWKLQLADFEELKKGLYKASTYSSQARKDLQEFSEEMITLYVEIPAKALKKVDKNHLNLGMRYAYITDKSLLCGSECFDVFSINSYQITPVDSIEKVAQLLDKPVMVGEFHQGALDRGLTAHGIRGVTTQEQRGCAYRYYVEQGLINPYFLGAHYFQLNDQSCLGRFDGENYQIGLIDICMQEYEEMVSAMKECHRTMYLVAENRKGAYNIVPNDIAPIHY